MIDELEKSKCTGCYACVNKCPTHCIHMEEDSEGFPYPKIDKEKCIKCNLCEKVCPIMTLQKEKNHFENPIIIGAYSKNEETRLDSTSGGIFSELAEAIWQENGYVSGAVYDDEWMVKHIVTNSRNDIKKLRSSKYIQSRIENCYREIEEKLKKGNKVMICAAPCQIAGLVNYLGKEYDNLILCDFICRGVNSPKIFKKYLESLEKKYHAKISKIKFKDKTYGWHSFSTRIEFENGKKYIGNRYLDSFMIGYLQYNAFMRPACYECHFKDFPRLSDITLADFWGIENIDKTLDQNKGTSMILLNSQKGKELFEKIKDNLNWKKIDSDKAFIENQCVHKSANMTEARKQVLARMDEMTYDEIKKRYFPGPSKRKKFYLKTRLLAKKILKK